jgi:hypothetical protein
MGDLRDDSSGMDWMDKVVDSYPCVNCGQMLESGILNAMEHYSDCYTKEQRLGFMRANMESLGYSKGEIKEFLDKIITFI